jgi:hypothetical protein
MLLISISVAGCSSSPYQPAGTSTDGAGRIASCKRGDTQVSAEVQCLQDDAACYQIANGNWCTGTRGNTCPAGSNAMAAGNACPAGMRCFDVGESLTCGISFQ